MSEQPAPGGEVYLVHVAPPPDPYAYYPQPDYPAAVGPTWAPPGKDIPLRRTIAGVAGFPALLALAGILTIPMIFYLVAQTGVDTLADGGMGFAEELMSPRFLGVNAAITVGAQLLIVVLALLFTGELRRYRDALALRLPVQKRWYFIAAALGVAAFALLQAISMAMAAMGGTVESTDTSQAVANTEGVTRALMLGLLVPFLIPLVEEVFFRGLIFNSIARGNWNRRLSPRTVAVIAALISSACFGFAHLQLTGGIGTAFFIVGYTGMIGLLNCWLVYQTGSIIPGWILHLVYNGITVITMATTGI